MKRKKGLLLFLTIVLFLFRFVPYVFGATVDVMIVYDTTAKSWVSTHGGMTAFAEDAVARMNQATANSGVNLTFRLVHAAEVSYTHSDLYDDLIDLQAGNGSLSVVHQWREAYGADIVAMFADTGSAYGTVGYGYVLTSYFGQPDWAFSSNAIRSVNISHTMTHEVGHNLGCDHSKYQTPDPGPNTYLNSYSAGWYFTGTDTILYHTIMAYNYDGYGNYYTEAPLFSTPLMIYKGTPAGDAADGDNASNIRETMDIVADYRAAILYVPTLSSPADGATGQAANASLTWLDTNSSPQETGYKVRIKPSGGSYTEYNTGQNATSYTTSGFTNGVTYYWSVKAVGNGTSTLDSAYPADISFTVILLTDNLLYASIPGDGIMKWDGSVWSQLHSLSPANMAASGSTLYATFTGYGLYKWDGSAWTQLHSIDPVGLAVSGSTLYVNFTEFGLYKWDGSAWTQLHSIDPVGLAVSGSTLYVNFTEFGLYKWDGSAWTQLHSLIPANMAASGSTLYATFTGYGLYKWDGSAWTQLHSIDPVSIAVSDSTLYVNFTDFGLWKWQGGAWSQLHSLVPSSMVALGSELYATFTGYGIWKWDGSAWSQVNSNDPAFMVAGF